MSCSRSPASCSDSAAKPRPYVCSVCSKSYIRSDHLARHRASAHPDLRRRHRTSDDDSDDDFDDDFDDSDSDSGDSDAATLYALRPLGCPAEGCTARFRLPDHLKRHVKRRHAAAEKCTWPGCPMSFSRHTLLVRHLAAHTGQKPFSCSKAGCNKAFDHPSQLRRHVQRHHEATHHCAEPGCQQSFARYCDLVQHRRTAHHVPPPDCELCGKSFATKNKRRLHMRSHSDTAAAQRVACTFDGCDKTYSTHSNMLSHYRATHQNLRDHACSIDGCQSAFPTPSALRRHQAAVHAVRQKRPRDQQSPHQQTAVLAASTPIPSFDPAPSSKLQRAC